MKNSISTSDDSMSASESNLTAIQARLMQNQQEAEREIAEYIGTVSSIETDESKSFKESQRTKLLNRFEEVLQNINRKPLADYSIVIEKLSEIEDLANGITSTRIIHKDGSEHLIRDAIKHGKMQTYPNLMGFAAAMQRVVCEIRAVHALKYSKNYNTTQLDNELKEIQDAIVHDMKNVLNNITSGDLNNAPAFNDARFHDSIRKYLKKSTKIEKGKDDAIEKAREIIQVQDKQPHISTIIKEKDAKGEPVYASKSHLIAFGASVNQGPLYQAVADAGGAKYKASGKNKKTIEIFNWYNSMIEPIRGLVSTVAPELATGNKVIPYFSQCLPGLKNPKKLVEAAYTIDAEPQQLGSAEIFSVAGIVAHEVVTAKSIKAKDIFQRLPQQDTKKQTELNVAYLTEIVGSNIQVVTVGNDRKSENKKLRQARDALTQKSADPDILKDLQIVDATDTKMLRDAIKSVVKDKDNLLNKNSSALRKTKDFLDTNRVEELVGQANKVKYEKVCEELDNFLSAHPKEATHIAELKYLVDAKYRNRTRLFGKKSTEEEQVIDNLVARNITSLGGNTALVIDASEASVLNMLEIDSKAAQELRFIQEGITSQKIKQENVVAHDKSNANQSLVGRYGAHGHKGIPQTSKRVEQMKTNKLNMLSRRLFSIGLVLINTIKDIIMLPINYIMEVLFPEIANFSQDGSREYIGDALKAQVHYVGVSQRAQQQYIRIQAENDKTKEDDMVKVYSSQRLYDGELKPVSARFELNEDSNIQVATNKSMDQIQVDNHFRKKRIDIQPFSSTPKQNSVKKILEIKSETPQQDWKEKVSNPTIESSKVVMK